MLSQLPFLDINSVYFKQLIPAPMPIQRILTPLHNCKHFLFLQTTTDDLHTNRQPSHRDGVIVFVCALRDAIEFLEVEGRWQSVLDGIHVGHRDDAGGVIKLSHVSTWSTRSK